MKRMFFSVLMMLFVAFAYAEGTPASTKLPVEKISVKKFSEALKNEQNSISFSAVLQIV